MVMIVESIPKGIKVVEFLSSHPKFFRNLEVVSLLEVL